MELLRGYYGLFLFRIEGEGLEFVIFCFDNEIIEDNELFLLMFCLLDIVGF